MTAEDLTDLDLHSNMVRFIIRLIARTCIHRRRFTFQYG